MWFPRKGPPYGITTKQIEIDEIDPILNLAPTQLIAE